MTRPQCVVYDAMALVLHVSRVVGIAPVGFRRRHDGWTIRVSPFFYAYSVILVSIIVSLGIAGVILDMNIDPSQSVRMRTPIKRILWIADFGTVVLTAFVGAYEGPFRMNNMIRYLNELHKINKSLNIQHSASKERIRAVAILCSYFGFFSVMMLDIWTTHTHALRFHRDPLVSSFYASFVFFYMTLIFLQSQFIVGAMAVHSTLKNLNNVLETQTEAKGDYKKIIGIDDEIISNKKHPILVRNKNSTIYSDHLKSQRSQKVCQTVRHIALSFSNFCQIVTDVTKCHEISLLLLLVFYVIHLIITPYYVSLALQSPDDQLQAMLQMVLWCIAHFISLVLLVEPCHWTKEEVNRTHILVSLLTERLSSTDSLLNAELNQFYKHLTLNKIAFSPFGMFTMGRPLCASIVGVLATYLVIIFQFQTTADRIDGF